MHRGRTVPRVLSAAALAGAAAAGDLQARVPQLALDALRALAADSATGPATVHGGAPHVAGDGRSAGVAAAPVAACTHLPRVTAAAAVPNDNTRSAGTLRGGTLMLRLEARAAAWQPEGADGCAIRMHAFAEEGRRASIPGPLIRVRAGTQVHVTLRNDLAETIHVRGLEDRDAESLTATPIAPGATHEFRFTATTAGTFYYWGDRRSGASSFAANEDGQLVGALIVDAADADVDDRVFVLTRWKPGGAAGEGSFELNAMNGLSWPHTEHLSLVAGEPVRWRVINATNDGHLMHLHGAYFRVLSLGDATRPDAIRRARRGALIVTEGLAPGETMRLEWTPERAGNWIFHCHIMAHMAPHQRLDRMPGAPTLVSSAEHTGHAEHDMAGLVIGVSVMAPTSAATADEVPRRRLRLFANARNAVFAERPGYAFVLQDGAAPPARDSIRIPGSPIVLTRDEPVEIVVHNRLAQPLAVHWHGLELESVFDGVAGWSGGVGSIAPAIAPGDSFTVRLTPPRAGTFICHVHSEHGEELSSGLYGPLLVVEPGARYDPARDFVFVIADAGPGVVRGDGQPPFINGTLSPPPLDLVTGETYRFRFIHIAANAAQSVTFAGPGEPEWRALARDGAAYAPELATRHPARNAAGPGSTFDFEYVPRMAGEYVLGVDTFGGGTPAGTPTVVRVRVRDREQKP
jgi:FtsP/CotA-like multicopper oxidase with cupredoxin domain